MDTQPIFTSPAEETSLPESEVTHISPAVPETGAAPSPEVPEKPKRHFHLPQWIRQRVTAARAAFLLGPWLAYIMVEVLNNNNPFTAHSTEQDILNLIWYYLIFWLFRMILGRKVLAGGVSAVVCFLFGLAKKMLLANAVAQVADAAFSAVSPSVALAWLGAVAYTFQIYFDFSAYSDMAIGLGRMFGFHFLENFNYPYVSHSVTEFWRRWHISLSTWFRDYVYIPLGGNRCSRARNILNLFLVWALTGLWHGANWTFIAWGLWFFVLLIGEKFLWGKALSRLPSLLQHVYAMLLVILSWVLFRADDIGAALCYMAAMFGRAPALCDSRAVYYALEFWPELLLCCIAALPVKNLLETALEKRNSKLSRGILIVGPKLASLALLALSYCRLVTGSFNPFIYFRF